jgi:uncharacterized protein (UPF0335 family)
MEKDHTVSSHDKMRISKIIRDNYGDWYDAKLIRLIAKADKKNRDRLRSVYPNVVEMVESWENSSEDDYELTDRDKGILHKIINKKYGDWYDAQLIRLIIKADKKNRERMKSIYPNVVSIIDLWIEHGYMPDTPLEKYYESSEDEKA